MSGASDPSVQARGRAPRGLFMALYASEGAPIGYLWWAMPVRMRTEGVPAQDIAFYLSLIALPWALKFSWAPLLDRAARSRGGVRAWVLCAQALMIASLAPLIVLHPGSDYGAVLACLLVHALAASTQDVGIDAIAIAASRPEERGSLNASMQIGMLLSRTLFGPLALFVGEQVDHRAVIALLIGAIAFPAIWLVRRPPRAPVRRTELDLRRLASALVTDRGLLRALAFAVVAGLGFEAVGGMAGPFLIDRGVPREWVAGILASATLLMAGVGLLGGRMADRLGAWRATRILCATTCGAVLLLAATDAALERGARPWVTVLALFPVYACIGAFIASSYAWFMDVADRTATATRFTLLMSATNLSESAALWVAGMLLGAGIGYAGVFAALGAVSSLAVALPRPRLPAGAG